MGQDRPQSQARSSRLRRAASARWRGLDVPIIRLALSDGPCRTKVMPCFVLGAKTCFMQYDMCIVSARLVLLCRTGKSRGLADDCGARHSTWQPMIHVEASSESCTTVSFRRLPTRVTALSSTLARAGRYLCGVIGRSLHKLPQGFERLYYHQATE